MSRLPIRVVRLLVFAACLGTATAALAGSARPPSFQGLGDLPTGAVWSRATGVSADGSVVVGSSVVHNPATGQNAWESFIWDAAGGMRRIDGLPSGVTWSGATDVADEGGTVVGYFREPGTSSYRGYRHDVGTGSTVVIDPLNGDSAYVFAVSGNGSLAVGEDTLTSTGESLPLLHDASGARHLSYNSGHMRMASGVSPDGAFIVGDRYVGYGGGPLDTEAVRWDAVNGFQGLGYIPGDQLSSASAVSDDGSIVVGWSGAQAARFEVGVGVTGLGVLPGHSSSTAVDVSGDGTRIVGSSRDGANGTRAFVWDDRLGMVALSVLLEQLGLDLTGWTLEHAIAISNDGTTIVGYGTNPLGFTEAFVATIPEPSTGLLLGLGLLGLGLRRRPL